MVLGLRRSGLAACEAIRRTMPGARGGRGATTPRTWTRRGFGRWASNTGSVGELVSMTGVTALVKSARRAGRRTAWSRPPAPPACRSGARSSWPTGCSASPIIGITGTNGKTTTTELVGAMLRAGDVPVEVAGNVGRPLCDLAGRVRPGHLDRLRAVQLPAGGHRQLPRAGGRGAAGHARSPRPPRHVRPTTCASKLRLFENQTADDTAVLNGDDPVLRAAEMPGAGRRVWFDRDQSDRIDWEHSAIRGDHNLENALAAAAAAEAVGVSRARRATARCASSLPPPHRLQTVAVRDGVSFVDDSKATNPEAVIKALTAYRRRRPADAGRVAEGRIVRRAGRRRGRRPGRVGRRLRRGGRADRRRAGRRAACRTAATRGWPPRWPPPQPAPTPETWCCCRRPAPASTSSRDYAERGDWRSPQLAQEVPVGR